MKQSVSRIVVKDRFLALEDGTPFFWQGDTEWELLKHLTREEVITLFDVRALEGFNVLQICALPETNGLTEPNRYGRLPLCFTDGRPDPEKPDLSGEYSWWAHVEYVLSEAEKRGMYVALLPTWGDKFNRKWGVGPVIFDPQNAYVYAKWLAGFLREHGNIIWMLGGDRPLETEEHRAIIDAMARGIRDGGAEGLITFHPMGSHTSVEYLPDAEYIDIHTAQTSHGVDTSYRSDRVMEDMRTASSRPYLDSEPRYEDHPRCMRPELGYWGAADVRQNLYWDVLSGTCGHTYGNHNIWCFNRKPCDYFPYKWTDVLHHPGAEQIHFAKELRLRRDYFSFRPAPELILTQYHGRSHLVAGMGEGYAYIYSPQGLPMDVDPAPLGAQTIRALWFDPRTGEETVFTAASGTEPDTFVPPTRGEGNDWVLILEKV